MTQYARVKSVLEEADKPLSLFQIRRRIRESFNRIDSECAISARIREVRHDLLTEGKTIASERVGAGKHYHVYWIAQTGRA